MADNVTLPGTGLAVSTDEVNVGGGLSHVQHFKLVDGTGGGTALAPATAARGLSVDPRPFVIAQATPTDSSGLTTSVTAYSAGDVLGAGWEITSVARSTGGTGLITGATLHDYADVTLSVDLYVAQGSVTFGTDNAAPSISDADSIKLLGVIGVGMIDLGGTRFGSASALSIPYICDGTSLFVYAVTNTAHTFFGAATDLKLRLFCQAD